MTFARASDSTLAFWGRKLSLWVLAVDIARISIATGVLALGLAYSILVSQAGFGGPEWVSLIFLAVLKALAPGTLAAIQLYLYKRGTLTPVFVLVFSIWSLAIWATIETCELFIGPTLFRPYHVSPYPQSTATYNSYGPVYSLPNVWIARISLPAVAIVIELVCITIASIGVHRRRRPARKADVFFVEPAAPEDQVALRGEGVSPLPGYLSPITAKSRSVRSAEYFDEQHFKRSHEKGADLADVEKI